MNELLRSVLVNPKSHGPLEYAEGGLVDPQTKEHFPIVSGIPVLLDPEQVVGLNKKYQNLYDRLAFGYDLAEALAVRFGSQELRTIRQSIADCVPVRAGERLLEVSIGTGLNIHNIAAEAEFYGLDLSLGMLKRCQRNARRWKREISLVQGNAEALPFQDESFDTVLHFGGINFFNNKGQAIAEMIRVARSNATIIVGDETENLVKDNKLQSQFYEKSAKAIYAPPLELIPHTMKDVRMRTLGSEKVYLITFVKP